jgi:putative pyruvate formate lyase activating enzyme
MSPQQSRQLCNICPRQCPIGSTKKKGICGIPHGIFLSSAQLHYGEEPIFTEKGVGNFFFTACNMTCVYCQNYQISQNNMGQPVSESLFIDKMFAFQEQDCAFIGLVSPSHQSPFIQKAIESALNQGFNTPIIYNSSAYDDVTQLKKWEGLIDVYLPDIRYSDNCHALRYSGVSDYLEISRHAITEMYRQVGNPILNSNSEIVSGLWVRHLVLPNGLSGSWESLCFLALELSPKVGLSLMAQYNPLYHAMKYPELSRCITQKEYDDVIEMSNSLGFETVFYQDVKTSPGSYVPDFNLLKPFVKNY